jgi:hypothetical protein
VEYSAAADELYRVLPVEFTAARKRLAGELSRDDARRLTALRRPTVPAWAVNALVRDGAAGPLLELGERMREAWSGGGDLGALENERNALVDDLMHRVRELADEAGRPLSDAFAGEVEETLRAAIADPAAADAVREGRLVHALRHAGFGPFGAAPARSAPARAPKPRGATADKERAERERAARQREREEAARLADEADRSRAEWKSELDAAQERLDAAEERLGALREQVAAAETRYAELDRKAQVARREHERAARTARDARRRADRLTNAE